MSDQTQTAPATTNEAPAANPTANTQTDTATNGSQTVQVNPNDLLQVGEIALAHIGHPAHHSEIIAKAKELGIAGDNIHNINPRIWADTRKPSPHQSKFRFFGKSVFGLAAWTEEQCSNWSTFVPTRSAAGAAATGTAKQPETLEGLNAKRTKLAEQLAALDKRIAEVTANPELLKAPAPKPAPAPLPAAPTREDIERMKDAAALQGSDGKGGKATVVPSSAPVSPPAPPAPPATANAGNDKGK